MALYGGRLSSVCPCPQVGRFLFMHDFASYMSRCGLWEVSHTGRLSPRWALGMRTDMADRSLLRNKKERYRRK